MKTMDLIKIQSELKAPKNQRNNFGKYNYRSCEDILEALKPILLKHKCTLTISDNVIEVIGQAYINSTVIFTDSQGKDFEVSAQAGIDFNRKGMDVAQSFGSSSSYARKYALNGMFLIDDTKEIDSMPVKKEKQAFSKPAAEKHLALKTPVAKLKGLYILTQAQADKYDKMLYNELNCDATIIDIKG